MAGESDVRLRPGHGTAPPAPRSVFLTAEWRNLVLLNYQVEPALLAPLVPAGTELDPWDGAALVSLVGFEFLRTRVLGVALPGHGAFPEVNLRFYVRRRAPEGWRHGVVFIQELVARPAICLAARLLYQEPYRTVPMWQRVALDRQDGVGCLAYGWTWRGAAFRISATVSGSPRSVARPSETAFVTERYWGYTRLRHGRSREYRVDHPPWQVWPACEARYQVERAPGFGGPLGVVLAGEPGSVCAVPGSAVTMYRGVAI